MNFRERCYSNIDVGIKIKSHMNNVLPKLLISNKDIAIILSHPQMGENIGAAARVMKNFGLKDLRIVSPRDGWPNEKTETMSAGGSSIIHSARIYSSIKEAIADREFVFATTAANRHMNKENIFSYEIRDTVTSIEKLGILFGRESSGLSNHEISLCNKIITIKADEEYSSLNLAQAICVICYEIYKIEEKFCSFINNPKVDLVTKNDMELFFDHLFTTLEKRKFFKSQDSKDLMMIKLRGIFNKMDNLSIQELNALHGIVALMKDR